MSRTIFYGRKDVQVTIQPSIGLDEGARQAVVEMLNRILADEFVLSLKTQQTVQPTEAVDSPEQKLIYDMEHKQLQVISNEIKERIMILGGAYLGSPEELLDAARLDGKPTEAPSIVRILADQEAFTRFLREDIRKCAEVYKDQGTAALLIGFLQIHEKMVWVLRSNMTSEQFNDETII